MATRRQSGPMRTAIMSLSMVSPRRIPASKRSSTNVAHGVVAVEFDAHVGIVA